MYSLAMITNSTKETMRFGSQLAKYLKSGDIICLYGDLGSGKTTLVKGVAHGLKIADKKVNSPTFVLLNIYEGKLPLYHFDFYRLENTKEIAAIGYDEFIYGNGVAMIEWAERFKDLLPLEHLHVDISFEGDTQRVLKFTAKGKRYEEILGKLEHHEHSRH